MRATRHAGHECVEVDAGSFVARITVDVGPRILHFGPADGPNLLAELPDATLDGPHGTYRLRGGHRLWTAPEVPDRTYRPDDVACSVDADERHVVVTAPDDGSGLERRLEVRAAGDELLVGHRVTNVGEDRLEVAPWAITQLPVGGDAILPMAPAGPSAFEASHALVLWPYTRLDDERLTFGTDHVLVRGTDATAPVKVGAAPGSGRLGYLRDGWLFMKSAAIPDPPLADRGAASQVYNGAGFLELETLGPLRRIGPGESLDHTERWAARPVDTIEAARSLVVS